MISRVDAPFLRTMSSGHRWRSVLAGLVCALVGSSCGGPPRPQVVDPIPGYLEPVSQSLRDLDRRPLNGRRILLDPGHGGNFRGAVGQRGLTEAEVNLGVALHLRGLLEWAGADVALTRTADIDFLSAADSSLAADLAFRVSLMDSLQPDVFLSLHHNSNAALDRSLNEIQTYYPLGDAGASLDLARSIHRHLVLNLGIEEARILPGNFHVLRNATVPAVLGEPAMLSNPVIEERLSLAASQRLEAEAYFLGLLDYFSSGSPVWSGAAIDTVIATAGLYNEGLAWTFRDSGDTTGLTAAANGPDPGSFELRRDGIPVGWDLSGDGRTVRWRPERELPPKPIVLEIHGRNLAGRAAPVRRSVILPEAATRLTVTLSFDSDGCAAVAWTTLDAAPLPAGALRWPDGACGIAGPGARGWLLMDPAPPNADEVTFVAANVGGAVTCDVRRDSIPAPWRWRLLQPGPDADEVSEQADSHRGSWRRRTTTDDAPSHPAFARDLGCPLVPVHTDRPAWLTHRGLKPLVDPSPRDSLAARTFAVAGSAQPDVQAVLPGLRGRIVVLDPAGGDGDADGHAPLGMRGADLNLETARQAAALLAGAGAAVHLTRQDASALPAAAKVRLADDVDADLFLTIRRSPRPGAMRLRHHAGSRLGARWAAAMDSSLTALACGADSVAVTPGWEYLLRHTSCPALDAAFPSAGTAHRELVLADADWPRAEARAILMAAAVLTATETDLAHLDPAAILGRLPGAPALADIDYVILDGNLLWTPCPTLPRPDAAAERRQTTTAAHSDVLASCSGPPLPASGTRHTLELHAADRWQLWLIDLGPGAAAPRMMFSNP